jgi:hypothetical protein
MSIPRSNGRPSTLRSDRAQRTYIITTSRITSGEEFKHRNGMAGLRGRAIPVAYPPFLTTNAFF